MKKSYILFSFVCLIIAVSCTKPVDEITYNNSYDNSNNTSNDTTDNTTDDTTDNTTDPVGGADITSGLVAYYPFNGNAADESTNSNDGTVTGATLTVDRFGNANCAYSFDGIDDYVNIGNSVKPSLPFSISLWVKYTGDGGGLIKNDRFSSNAYYNGFLIHTGSTGALEFVIGSGYASPNTRKSAGTDENCLLNDEKWYHIVAIAKSASDMHIYINTADKSVSYYGSGTTITYSTNDGVIASGNDASGADRFYKGLIDDMRIYNRALSSDEVTALYQEGGWTGN